MDEVIKAMIEPDFWAGRGRYAKRKMRKLEKEVGDGQERQRSGGDLTGVQAHTQADAPAGQAGGAEKVGAKRRRVGRGGGRWKR